MPLSSDHRIDSIAQASVRAVLDAAGLPPDTVGDVDTRLQPLAIASDFAVHTLQRQPELLQHLLHDPTRPLPAPELTADNRSDWPRLLRRYRQAESTRLVWCDVVEQADVVEILHGSTQLADTCLQIALQALEDDFVRRFGTVRAADGTMQRLVVFALGKQGGGELNFSSDIDLVYACNGSGDSDGTRSLASEDYFTRLGQQLTRLLDDTTADGFCHRVDLRLRPFGTAGRLVLPFAALEQYFQREGRDWERYAWQKARPVAGDVAAGEDFLQTLRPFVYRRYLDFGALDGLRAMKAGIAAEVARQELADDVKRGPGGIRELEFLVQVLQLIRGGREPALQQRGFLQALQALQAAGHLPMQTARALEQAYRFLRRLENRLQMLADAQTYAIPADPLLRERIAKGLGHASWPALAMQWQHWRELVTGEFGALLAPRRSEPPSTDLAAYWHGLPDGDAEALLAAGFTQAATHAALVAFAQATGAGELSDAAHGRLHRLMPALLQQAAATSAPDAAVQRVLPLLQNVLRRTPYLALLDEVPSALHRLVDAASRSGLLAERLARHPLLLDELLDARLAAAPPDREGCRAACENAVLHAGGDTEAALQALNEVRQTLSFRVALATLDARQPAPDSVQQLTWLADAVLEQVLRLARAELQGAHGLLEDARFAVLGYGSLGGAELGFGSDLDLVFVFDGDPQALSDGPRPLEASRWFGRLAQKVVALLGTVTAGGKLYEIDIRLRPDGASGLLVSTLASYADYQLQRAWTWEHQALVRARGVAGDAGLLQALAALRTRVLGLPRDPRQLQSDILAMRTRMRGELDRGSDALFDLKQGVGGLTDLQFLLQWLVLRHAGDHPDTAMPHATAAQLAWALDGSIITTSQHADLHAAHATLLDAGLRCTLDRRPRLVRPDAHIAQARAAIIRMCAELGLPLADQPESR